MAPIFGLEEWGCNAADLAAAEEEEQPKVAFRRLILAAWPGFGLGRAAGV